MRISASHPGLAGGAGDGPRANPNVEQKFLFCAPHELQEALTHTLCEMHPNEKTIIFCNTKAHCDELQYRVEEILDKAPPPRDTEQRADGVPKRLAQGVLACQCQTGFRTRLVVGVFAFVCSLVTR